MENSTGTCQPSDTSPRERTRQSVSLSNENYDMVWHEANRRGFPQTVALNLLLDELREWRSGTRRFTERRKQVRVDAKGRPGL